MKIKELYLWQMIDIKKSLYLFYSIIYVIYLFSIISAKMTGEIQIGGMDVSSAIYIFIASLAFFGETFRFALGNGVSRKTMLITQVCTMLSISALMTIIDALNRWLFAVIVNKENFAIFNDIYGNKSGLISKIILTFGCYIMLAAFGYFVATLNSRLSKLAKIVMYVGISALLIVGVPLGISAFSESVKEAIGRFFNNFFSYLTASPYNMFLVAIVSSVVLYIFSILLVRKAPLKVV